jgi:ADP-heptose:LPS heptosyltransferase
MPLGSTAVAQRILVVRMKAIGDVMFTRPALAALRESFPKARIAYLTGAVTEPLVRTFSEVDDVLVLDRRQVGWNRPWSSLRSAVGLWRQLRAGRFDLGIDFHGNAESAAAPWFAGAAERWGWSVGNEYRRWYTHHESVESRPGTINVRTAGGIEAMHPADWHLEFLRRCGLNVADRPIELTLGSGPRGQAEAFCRSHGLDSPGKTLFFQPFSSSGPKDWPVENQLVVARHWSSRGYRVVFGGGPGERDRLAPVVAAGFPVAAGLDLLAMTALMARCVLSVGPDTGLIHLAQAAGARVLDLRRYKNAFPHRHPEWAITAPGTGTVSDIPIQAVLDAMAKALGEAG